MAASQENYDIGSMQGEINTLNELRIMPTDSVLEKLTTLQVKRSQTAGVAETSTNMGNIFEKVRGLPIEGPSYAQQKQVRKPEIGRAEMHQGNAHRNSISASLNIEGDLQKQIDN